jgi:hypothetical protein
MAKCAVCGKDVAPEDQAEHLRTSHLGPHYFWFDARKFRTVDPSLTMGEIKKLAEVDPTYQAYQEKVEGGAVPWSDGQSIDLTRTPHFFAVPPATAMGG